MLTQVFHPSMDKRVLGSEKYVYGENTLYVYLDQNSTVKVITSPGITASSVEISYVNSQGVRQFGKRFSFRKHNLKREIIDGKVVYTFALHEGVKYGVPITVTYGALY